MSHQPEREEKDCLNCGTIVHGRYCHLCGQENIVTHQNFVGLVKHFIYDIFHFDGKFFDTLKHLLTKPGFVAKEYVRGKRAKYLDPIRMYLFTSAVFFVLFFSFVNPDLKVDGREAYLAAPERTELVRELQKRQRQNVKDSSLLRKIELLLDTTRPVKRADIDTVRRPFINFFGNQSKSIKEYDSVQNALSADKKDGWLKSKIIKKGILIDSKYSGNIEEMLRKFFESFLHRMPYLLFLSLPFFALILKLLYVRRKAFFYSDHAIFTLYHYIFSFFILLVLFGLIGLKDWLHWEPFDWLIFLLFLGWFFYLYKSLRNFYGQKRAKTIGKFLLLNLLGFVTMLFLFCNFSFSFNFSIVNMKSNGDSFERLIAIMDELREKCPWDKKQTIESLRQQTLEETYELTEAISEKNWKYIKEELGDLLLHIVFYTKIASEEKQFAMVDVIESICTKLISRHPHIYGDVKVNDEEDVKRNWEKLKIKEGKKSAFSGVPKALPSLIKAMRLQEKAKQVGFEWENKEQVWEKVEEEVAELKEAIAENDHKKVEEEFGDVLFSMVNFARFLDVDAENALEVTNKKFTDRFTKMEETALARGSSLNDMTLEQMDAIWNEIKQHKD